MIQNKSTLALSAQEQQKSLVSPIPLFPLGMV
jgi:hypothetical protein